MDGLTSLLSGLSLAEKKEDYLARIKPALSTLSRAEISAGLYTVDLIVLFDCLNTGNSKQIETTCGVLRFLLDFIDPVNVLQRYGELMRLGLEHPSEQVPHLVVQQLLRFVGDDDLAVIVGEHTIFLPAVLKLGGDLALAAEVSKFLSLLAETRAGLQIISRTTTLSTLQSLCALNEVVKLRVLEVAVKISQTSQEHLDVMSEAGLLTLLTNLLHSRDFLTRLNAVELATNLALTHQGIRYLESQGVLKKLEELLVTCQNEPFADELFPGLVKFFGNVAHLRPRHTLSQYALFQQALLDMTDSPDLIHKVIAFETIGYIGESLEGKASLAELGNRFTHCLEKLGQVMRDGLTETRLRGINAFASLVKLDKENQTAELLSLTQCWYRRALEGRGQPMDVLAGMAKLPFPDLRLAAYAVLNNIAQQDWGRAEILRCPGFLEFLLDREAERDKAGKEAKFQLLVSLANSGQVRDLVGHELEFLLLEYVRMGPFYVAAQSQVAFQSA